MRTLRSLRSFLVVAVAATLIVAGLVHVASAVSPLAAVGLFLAINALPLTLGNPHVLCAVNSLGTVQGALIIQRALQMALTKYPVLRLFAMGFQELDGSVQQATLGQTVYSRIRSGMTVGNFGDAPNALSMTDVPGMLRNFRQLHVAFTPAEYNATNLSLVDQAAEPLADAIARGIVRSVATSVCRSNFKTTVNSVAPYLSVASAWDYSNTVIEMMEMANDRGIPRNSQRYFLVNSAVNASLLQDELIVAEKNNPANMLAIQNGRLPMVSGFQFDDFPQLPNTDGNLIGFAGVPDALLYVARAPKDPTAILGAGTFPGVINTITEPNSGFSVMVLQYVTPGSLVANTVLLWLDGISVGNPGNLIRLVDGVVSGTANTIVGATITNPGYGYLASAGTYDQPTITVSGGGGADGAVTATVSNDGSSPLNTGGGAVTGLTVSNAGSSYEECPELVFAVPAGGKTAAHATAVATVAGLN